MKHVLITGAAGFVGSHVVETFHAAGWKIRATDRAGSDFSVVARDGVEIRPADLRRPEEIPALLEGIDTVVHLAAFFDFALSRRVLYDANVLTTENLCGAAIRYPLKSFVHLSTVGVYGNPKDNPCTEESRKAPQNAYEETKWLSERTVMDYHRKYGLPVRALRPTLIYGPRNRGGFALIFGLFSLLVHRRGIGVPVYSCRPIGHMVHAEDVARGCLHLGALPGGDGQAFNISDDDPMSMGELFKVIQGSLGVRTRSVRFPYAFLRFFSYASMALPRPVLSRLNRYFARSWKVLQKRHNLFPGFVPRLDRDWFEYMLVDHVYSNAKLKATGFTLKHPTARETMEQMVRWYRVNRWIPPAKEHPRTTPRPVEEAAAAR